MNGIQPESRIVNIWQQSKTSIYWGFHSIEKLSMIFTFHILKAGKYVNIRTGMNHHFKRLQVRQKLIRFEHVTE